MQKSLALAIPSLSSFLSLRQKSCPSVVVAKLYHSLALSSHSVKFLYNIIIELCKLEKYFKF